MLAGFRAAHRPPLDGSRRRAVDALAKGGTGTRGSGSSIPDDPIPQATTRMGRACGGSVAHHRWTLQRRLQQSP
jgi:hypothetical protein